MSNKILLSVLYSALAAGLEVAAHALPPEYQLVAAGAVGVLLLNLRNAWHLPSGDNSTDGK